MSKEKAKEREGLIPDENFGSENLFAMVHGIDLNYYQRGLAQREYYTLCRALSLYLSHKEENASLKEQVKKLGDELKKLSESTAIAEAETSDLEQELEKMREAIGCVIQYEYKFMPDPNYESKAWIVTSYGQKRGEFSNIPTHDFKHIK